MRKNSSSIFLCFLLIPAFLFSQKKVSYSLDTARILSNENLGGFILKLSTDTFINFKNKNAIPKGIKEQLDHLANGFSIANPDQEYRCCCTSLQRFPERKLLFLSMSKDVLAMTYLTGGWGVMTHLLLIRFEEDKIIDLWTGYYFKEVTSLDDIVKYAEEIKNKKIKANTNLVTL